MSRCALSIFWKHPALNFLGAVFCVAAVLSLSACEKKGTPGWDRSPDGLPDRGSDLVTKPLATSKSSSTSPSAEAVSRDVPVTTPSQGEVRFITYNVENWLTMNRRLGNRKVTGASKPDSEKQAVAGILARHTPDVIGLCEIGTPSDLKEIQTQLKAAGLDLPHSHYTGGSDPERHLGLLSRFPVISTVKPAEMEYQLAGRTFSINRGILDSVIEAHGKSYRFVGVHLKSKRDSEQGDQELIRQNEARLLRRHVDAILKVDKNTRLIVYGDFNDTRSSPTIKTITGKYNDPCYLTAIPAKDTQGHSWTHFWALRDVYSRFDFIFVAREVRREIDFRDAKIIDDREWNDASDHRAVMAVFK